MYWTTHAWQYNILLGCVCISALIHNGKFQFVNLTLITQTFMVPDHQGCTVPKGCKSKNVTKLMSIT